MFWYLDIPFHVIVFGYLVLSQSRQFRDLFTSEERIFTYVLGVVLLFCDLYRTLPIETQVFHLSDYGFVENFEVFLCFLCAAMLFAAFWRFNKNRYRGFYLFFSSAFLCAILVEVRYGAIFFGLYQEKGPNLLALERFLWSINSSRIIDDILVRSIFVGTLCFTSFFILLSPGFSLSTYFPLRKAPKFFLSHYKNTKGVVSLILRFLLLVLFLYGWFLIPSSLFGRSSEVQQLTYDLCAVAYLAHRLKWPNIARRKIGWEKTPGTRRKSKRIIILILIFLWAIIWGLCTGLNHLRSIPTVLLPSNSTTGDCARQLTIGNVITYPRGQNIIVQGSIFPVRDQPSGMDGIRIHYRLVGEGDEVLSTGTFDPFIEVMKLDEHEDIDVPLDTSEDTYFYRTFKRYDRITRMELQFVQCQYR